MRTMVKSQSESVVKLLIDAGADVNAQNSDPVSEKHKS